MPFRFSLQEVLDYRDQIVEQRQRDVAKIQGEIDRIEQLLRQVEKMRVQYRREMDEKMPQSSFTYAHREVYIRYIHSIEDLTRRSGRHLVDLRVFIGQKRQILAEAAQNLQVMEELKKEEWRIFQMSEKRQEAKLYDEIAIRQYLTRAGEKDSVPREEALR